MLLIDPGTLLPALLLALALDALIGDPAWLYRRLAETAPAETAPVGAEPAGAVLAGAGGGARGDGR